jgi:hypothetical protein
MAKSRLKYFVDKGFRAGTDISTLKDFKTLRGLFLWVWLHNELQIKYIKVPSSKIK